MFGGYECRTSHCSNQCRRFRDQIENEKEGLFVQPRNPKELANAIIRCLDSAKLKQELGLAARNKVLSSYNSQLIGGMIELHYQNAILNK